MNGVLHHAVAQEVMIARFGCSHVQFDDSFAII